MRGWGVGCVWCAARSERAEDGTEHNLYGATFSEEPGNPLQVCTLLLSVCVCVLVYAHA